MLFGKRYQVGNYSVIKFNKTLRKQDVAALRAQMGFPKEEYKNLQRAQLPYIKIEAVSGIWAIEFCCNTTVFHMLDVLLGEDEDGNKEMFAHLFNMWFMDTTVPGDEEYQEAKAIAMKAFMERRKADEVNDEEDQKTIEELKAMEEAKTAIVEISEEVKKEDHDSN